MLIIEFGIIVLLIFVDQLVKILSAVNLPLYSGNRLPIIDGVFSLTYLENDGAAFGIFTGQKTFLIIVTIIAVLVIIATLLYKKKMHIVMRMGLVLILSGALGNLFDRIKFGYVRDMFSFEFINFAVFNVADALLCIGVVLFIIYVVFIYKDPPKKAIVGIEHFDDNDVKNERK